jgi:hypothetical protein
MDGIMVNEMNPLREGLHSLDLLPAPGHKHSGCSASTRMQEDSS